MAVTMPAPNAPSANRPAGTASRLLYWGTLVFFLSVLAAHAILVERPPLPDWRFLDLIPWIAVVAAANLFPIKGWRTFFTPDIPIALAASLLLSPVQAGLVLFIGATDRGEFARTVSPGKALFNRSQSALGVYLGAVAVHAVDPIPSASKLIILLCLLSLVICVVVNHFLVGLALALQARCSLLIALPRLQIGRLTDFILTYVGWGLLGSMLTALYVQVGPLSLVACLGPLMVARGLLVRSQMYVDTARAYKSRETALEYLSQQVTAERTDERRLIAAELHDEVVQPLFKVSLLAQVLREDVRSGRLLELDDDIPDLIGATEAASQSLRNLVADLRQSTLGRGGLSGGLSTLARGIAQEGAVNMHAQIDSVETDPTTELAIYQIAKEALGNLIKHSHAHNAWVTLSHHGTEAELTIRDDGVGFDSYRGYEQHFGILIMRERAASSQASIFIDSSPGSGTSVRLIFPVIPRKRS